MMGDSAKGCQALDDVLQQCFLDLVQSSADTMTFTSGSEHLDVTLLNNKNELKVSHLSMAYLKPLIHWLHEHYSPFKTQDPRPAENESTWKFFATVRVDDCVLSLHVSKTQRLNGSTQITLSQITRTSLAEALERFGFPQNEQASFLQILDSENGLLILSSPSQDLLQLSLGGIICFAGFRRINVVTDISSLKNAPEGCLTIATLRCDDPIDAILQAHAAGVDFTSTTLLGSLCHGLIKRICPGCAREAAVDSALTSQLPQVLRDKLHGKFCIGRGCEQCGHTGYAGRIGIRSFVPGSSALEELVLTGMDHSSLIEFAYNQGAVSLIEDGLSKVVQGTTSLEALYQCVKVLPEVYLKHLINQASQKTASQKPLSLPDDFFVGSPTQQKGEKPLVGPAALARDPLEGAALLEEPVLPASAVKKREKPLLLIVEDDADQRSILEMLFKGSGYDILVASDGVEALQKIEQDIPDLVVSDLMMPRMDGGQLVKEIRNNDKYKRLPVLMLTVVSDVQKEYELLDLGADDYCEKTIQRKILLKRIENLLKRS